MNSNDYLKHFGVKGMRWGVRKRSEQSGTGSNRKKKSIVKSLTDYKARQNTKLKNRYANLTNKQAVGLGFTSGTILGVGKAIAEKNLKNAIPYAAEYSLVLTGAAIAQRDLERKMRETPVSSIKKNKK